MKSSNDLPSCALQVNGMAMKAVQKGQVGKVVVMPGVLTLQGVPNDPLATFLPTQVEARAGDNLLVTQNLLHKVGLLGGAASGAFVHSLTWTKADVLSQIRNKTAVDMAQ